jgi:plasmid stabilization system protein ParE
VIPVVVPHRAESDVTEAHARYAADDERLGLRFTQEVTRTLDRIAALPDQFPEVGNGVRRALLHRFPYAAYFVRRESLAIVVAVLHQHQRPGGWRPRAKFEGPGQPCP